MTVENVARALQGVYCNDQSDPTADAQDTFTDLVYNLPIVLDAAAGTDYTYASFKAPFRFKVIDATICPGAALTAADATANANSVARDKGAEARKDASADKRDADYVVAKERCDVFAGDTKSNCLTQAKVRFGKS